MRKRILYAQNFLRNKKTVIQIINISSIGLNDVILEIGAGQGIITSELINRCKKVIAYELDRNLSTFAISCYQFG